MNRPKLFQHQINNIQEYNQNMHCMSRTRTFTKATPNVLQFCHNYMKIGHFWISRKYSLQNFTLLQHQVHVHVAISNLHFMRFCAIDQQSVAHSRFFKGLYCFYLFAFVFSSNHFPSLSDNACWRHDAATTMQLSKTFFPETVDRTETSITLFLSFDNHR